MSKLFRQASRLNKTRYKFELRLEIQSLSIHPLHKERDVTVTLTKAGSSAGRSATTGRPRKPAGPWGDTLSLVVSLYRDRHGRYQPKPMMLVVKPVSGTGAGKPLASFKLDASHFASAAGTKEACELQSVNKKDDGRLRVEVACIFLRQSDASSASEASSVISASVIEEGEEEAEDEDEDEGEPGEEGRASDQDLSGFEEATAPGGDGSETPSPFEQAIAAAAAKRASTSLRPPQPPHQQQQQKQQQQQRRPVSLPLRRAPQELMPPPPPRAPVADAAGAAKELDEAVKEKEALRKKMEAAAEAHGRREAELLARIKALDAAAPADTAVHVEVHRTVEARDAAKVLEEKDQALAAAAAEVVALKARVAALEGKEAEGAMALQAKEADLAGKDEALRRFEETVAGLEKELAASKEGALQGEIQRKRLETEATVLREGLDAAEAERREKEEEEEEAGKARRASVEAMESAMATRLAEAEAAAVRLDRERGELAASLAETEAALTKAKMRRDVLEEERGTLVLRTNELLEELQAKRAALAGAESSAETLRIRAVHTEEEKGAMQQRVGELEGRVQALEAELADKVNATGGGEKGEEEEEEEEEDGPNKALDASAVGRSVGVGTSGSGHGGAMQQLQAQLHAAEEQLEKLRQKISGLEWEKQELESALETETARVAADQAEAARAHDEAEAQAAAQREMERTAQLLEARVLQEEAHARAAADARESAEAELEALSERVREMEEREEERAALEGEVRSLQSALAVAQEEYARSKQSWEEATSLMATERDTFRDELIEAKLSVAQLREEIDTLRLQLNRLRAGGNHSSMAPASASHSPAGSRSSSPMATLSPSRILKG